LIFFSSLREHREGTLDAAIAECSSRCERHPLHKEDFVYLESFNNGNKMGSCKVTLSIQCNVSEIILIFFTDKTNWISHPDVSYRLFAAFYENML
jgi:hypothetical protein